MNGSDDGEQPSLLLWDDAALSVEMPRSAGVAAPSSHSSSSSETPEPCPDMLASTVDIGEVLTPESTEETTLLGVAHDITPDVLDNSDVLGSLDVLDNSDTLGNGVARVTSSGNNTQSGQAHSASTEVAGDHLIPPEARTLSSSDQASVVPGLDSTAPNSTAPDGSVPGSEHQALYRRWRSRTFSDVVGQRHVTDTLCNAVRLGQVGHAYLFCGPRGTGKTSTARILARAVTCRRPQDGEPCNTCDICLAMEERRSLDLVEIDAASNNSVDDVRNLRDNVSFSPAQASRKVYIIDEVHMLSTSAFNALLKTLEEPPSHVLFILATTEAQRVPATILSRCQRHDFRLITPGDITTRLADICSREGIAAQPEALALLATYATGSLRDALSLLDQAHAFAQEILTTEIIQEALGLADPRRVAGLADALIAGELGTALDGVADLADRGADLRQVNRQLTAHFRDLLLAGARGGRQADVPGLAGALRAFMQADSAARRSSAPQLALELAMVDALTALQGQSQVAPVVSSVVATQRAASAPLAPSASSQRSTATNTRQPSAPVSDRPPVQPDAPVTTPPGIAGTPTAPTGMIGIPSVDASKTGDLTLERVRAVWPRLKQEVKAQQKKDLLGILNTAGEPVDVHDTRVVIGFVPPYGFLKDRADKPANIQILSAILTQLLGQPVTVQCVTLDSKERTGTASAGPKPVATRSVSVSAPPMSDEPPLDDVPPWDDDGPGPAPVSNRRPDPPPSSGAGTRRPRLSEQIPPSPASEGNGDDFFPSAERALRMAHFNDNPA